jgi:photosystem II P680 reaction center D1 protein
MSTMAFNLNGLNINLYLLDYLLGRKGLVINTWADVLNRADLDLAVIQERNDHGYPFDPAAAEVNPVVLKAPAEG